MPKVVFMGTPEFAIPALERLAQGGYDIAGVVTQPDRPAGRGRLLVEAPVKAWARAHGLAVYTPESLRTAEAQEELRYLSPDVIVVAAYGKLLPAPVRDAAPRGAINIHPSLLPRYRGPSPVAAAILGGDVVTGSTIMLLDKGMDSGPVLAQRVTDIAPDETTGRLTMRLALLGADLLLETLPRWMAGGIEAVPQDHERATVCHKITKGDGEIDWSLPAEDLARQVRAYQPWPGAYVSWRDDRVKLVRVGVVDTDVGPPGTVAAIYVPSPPGQATATKAVVVATGRGALVVHELQPGGKRNMTAQEFLAGRPGSLGTRLQR